MTLTTADLADLHARCFTMPRPWSEAEFAEFLASCRCFLLEAPAGFVLGRVIADEAEVLTIAVAPEARRTGTGRALMVQFAQAAQACGATQGFLEVAADNQPAQALYAATGWQVAGRRKGYYHDGHGHSIDAIVMTLAL